MIRGVIQGPEFDPGSLLRRVWAIRQKQTGAPSSGGPGVDRVGREGGGIVWESSPVIVRPRTNDDVDACVRMATIIHDLDGYPTRRSLDLREFLVSPDALKAWVAERDGQVVGHVALHRHSTPEVLAMASHALSRPVEQLGVVARLLVSPDARRERIGRTLLNTASSEATSRGLWPILDVVTTFEAAVSLYESCGWVRAGRVAFRFDDGGSVEEFVYLGPQGASA